MKDIVLKGIKYPIRMTMGAMLRFKQQMGYDISEMKGSLEEVACLMYSSVKSACSADDVDCPLSFEEFSDNIDMAELNRFKESNEEPTEEKKSRKRS